MASDDFNRSNGALGANWTASTGTVNDYSVNAN